MTFSLSTGEVYEDELSYMANQSIQTAAMNPDIMQQLPKIRGVPIAPAFPYEKLNIQQAPAGQEAPVIYPGTPPIRPTKPSGDSGEFQVAQLKADNDNKKLQIDDPYMDALIDESWKKFGREQKIKALRILQGGKK